MTYVRSQYIIPPHYKKQEAISASLKKKAVTEDKGAERNHNKWSAKLKPVKVRHHRGPWAQYAKYWYADGRTA